MIAVLWVRGRPYFKVPALRVPDPPPPALMLPKRRPSFPLEGHNLPVAENFEYEMHVFHLQHRDPSYGLAHYVHASERQPGTAQLELELRRETAEADEETLATYALLLNEANLPPVAH